MISIKTASERSSKNAHLCPSSGESKRTENLQHHLQSGQCLHGPPSQGCVKWLGLAGSQSTQGKWGHSSIGILPLSFILQCHTQSIDCSFTKGLGISLINPTRAQELVPVSVGTLSLWSSLRLKTLCYSLIFPAEVPISCNQGISPSFLDELNTSGSFGWLLCSVFSAAGNFYGYFLFSPQFPASF